MTHRPAGARLAALAVVVALALAGCSTLGLQSKAAPPRQTGSAPAAAAPESNFVYYDFDDIAVPSGFKLSSEDSFVYQSGGLKSGLLVFDGRIEPVSATNFMVAAMTRDNWRLKSSFKYNRTLMLFEKPGKVAFIAITESITNTRLEVWVAPIPEAGAGPQPVSVPVR